MGAGPKLLGRRKARRLKPFVPFHERDELFKRGYTTIAGCVCSFDRLHEAAASSMAYYDARPKDVRDKLKGDCDPYYKPIDPSAPKKQRHRT